MPIDISVVVCTYNRSLSLQQTLEALGTQTVPTGLRYEIVVVDNNSNDNTRDVIHSFAKKSAVSTQYVFEQRQGQCFARNTGISTSQGTAVAFTDDDVTPETDWIKTIWEGLHQHRADGIGGKVLPRWPTPPPRWITSNRNFLMFLSLLDAREFGQIQNDNGVRIIGANMAFKRELFTAVGLFDVTLGAVGTKLYRHDETEFVMRTVNAGKKIFYDPKLVVWQNLQQERLTSRYFRKYKFDNGEQKAARLGTVSGRTIFGVPLYAFRSTSEYGLGWVRAVARRDPEAFRKQLDLWYGIGFIWGRFKLQCSRRNSAVCD
jgi:glycosyltransferase involved in cell wall biosynthesis